MQQRFNDSSWLTWMVRITAGIVIVLLIVFFVMVIRNSSTITNQVSTIKEGPYPTSVANGHIETHLVHLETMLDHMTGSVLFEDETSRDENEDVIDAILTDINDQIGLINPDYLQNENDFNVLKTGIKELRLNTPAFLLLCREATNPSERSYTELSEYVTKNLDPIMEDMMEANNNMLNESTIDVEHTYTVVNESVKKLVVVSVVLMIAVLIMIIVFTLLLRKRSLVEEKAREQLAITLQSTREVNEAKSAFLSNMSHDMRTPMNAIVGLTSIANDHIDDKLRVKQCLTRISTSSQHLLSLINDVLDMNKIESGKVSLAKEEFSLSDLVSEIVMIIQSQSATQKLNSEITVENIVHEVLIGDIMRLRQILLNLTSNAIKYTNEGDTVRLAVLEEAQDREDYANIMFKVEDTGIGMKSDFVKRIFEPFERERNDFTNFTEGTGLGMAITKNLVDLMGGTIKVESELGMGTSVTIVLPFKIAKGVTKRREELERAKEAFEGMNALVIDNVQLVAENTRSLLEGFNISTKSALSSKCALREVKEQSESGKPFDIIIVDKDTSEGSGIKLAQELAEVSPQSHIVLSTYDVENIKDEATQAGIKTFIAKPLFRSRVLDVFNRALNPGEEVFEDVEGPAEENGVIKPRKQKKKAHVKGRVLIVEDNEINMEIAKTLVADRGADVEEAFNGVEAITLVSDHPSGYYDLIFMDWRMPHMNGIEATKAIRQFLANKGREQTPIVAMTANTFDSDRTEALAAGMDDFMGKPINIAELDAIMEKYLTPYD